jgi:hypothetical protein
MTQAPNLPVTPASDVLRVLAVAFILSPMVAAHVVAGLP